MYFQNTFIKFYSHYTILWDKNSYKITSLAWGEFAYIKSVCKQNLVEETVPDYSYNLSMDIVQNRK